MSFNSNIIILKNYVEDLEVELKKIEEKKIKSSGAKARNLLQKIKLECNQLRKDVLIEVKAIPTKSRNKKVEIKEEVEEIPPAPSSESSSDEAPKKKKPRGRPKKVTA